MNKLPGTALLSAICVFILSSCSGELLDSHVIDEEEPNEFTYQANEIEESNVYRGRIARPVDGEADTDLFKIWRPSGTVIVFEFEGEDEKFLPYVGHGDNSGHGEFALFELPGRYIVEFAAAVTGWHYFEIGDRRNVFEDGEKFGGFRYYFRVSSYHICHENPDAVLNTGGTFSGRFLHNYGNIEVVSLETEDYSFQQLNLVSDDSDTSDKFMFIYDCDARQTVMGNDDEDYYSRMYDPLIYGSLEKGADYVLIAGRIVADLTTVEDDLFKISLVSQTEDKELEPNNLYNYANRTGRGPVYGELSSEPVKITGMSGDDVDIFKYSFQKGELVNFEIETENEKEYMAEFWVGSYSETGSMVVPLRFSQLSGEKKHHINMYMPFTGYGYLFLEGNSIPYRFSVDSIDTVEELLSVENEVSEIFDTPECKWVFRKWKMPEEGDVFEIKIDGENSPAGIHIFSSDGYPYVFVPPAENNRFFIHRYEKTEELILGFYFENCDQDTGNSMELWIIKEEMNHIKWMNGFESTPVEVTENGAYQGLIDTDNYFVENVFEFEAWKDGTLHLTTAPDISALNDFDIDTVITLVQDDEEIGRSDNMIEFLNYNKYSFLTHEIKKGEQYQIKVKPYMSESSHIPSMNIVGNYILDIRIK